MVPVSAVVGVRVCCCFNLSCVVVFRVGLWGELRGQKERETVLQGLTRLQYIIHYECSPPPPGTCQTEGGVWDSLTPVSRQSWQG